MINKKIFAILTAIVILASVCLAGCQSTTGKDQSGLDISTPVVINENQVENTADEIQTITDIVIVDAEALEDYAAADMSGYHYLTDAEHCFKEIETLDVVNMIDEGKTFIVVFTHTGCPWCQAAMPVLNDVAKTYGLAVGCVDVRKDPSWKSNLDIENYDDLVERIGEFFPLDSDDLRHLYVPHVFFVKDGEVVHEFSGAGVTYNGEDTPLNDEQIVELTGYYMTGIEKLAN